jgi:hypothetical protein
MSEPGELMSERDRQGAADTGVWGRQPPGSAMSEPGELMSERDRQGAADTGVWGRSPQGQR